MWDIFLVPSFVIIVRAHKLQWLDAIVLACLLYVMPRGGSENGINFYFRNQLGGSRGVIYQQSGPKFVCMVEGGPYIIFPNYNFEEFPQLVSLSFFGQNSRLFPVTQNIQKNFRSQIGPQKFNRHQITHFDTPSRRQFLQRDR